MLVLCQWRRKDWQWAAAPVAADRRALRSPGEWPSSTSWARQSHCASVTVLLQHNIWHIFICLITFWLQTCGVQNHSRLPQSLWTSANRLRFEIENVRPQQTSASRLWLETALHYTSSKTYPLFMGPYFNTISTLHNHPPKYLCASNQRSGSSQSNFARAERNELGLRKWRCLHHTRLNLISGLIMSLHAVKSHIP